jgi:hypothetical protein
MANDAFALDPASFARFFSEVLADFGGDLD